MSKDDEPKPKPEAKPAPLPRPGPALQDNEGLVYAEKANRPDRTREEKQGQQTSQSEGD
jgi:hypothetical protein